ncbi:conserved hypothetical protein, membrane [Beggiatoa sp. PS]|nr:conserved hypothetical protein, membrane [Beggiatoa sp. PS]
MSEVNMKEDLYPSHLNESDLEEKDLKTLRREAETKAKEAINWYIQRKNSKSAWSKFLRISAIFMIFAGGLSPILQGIEWFNLQDCQYGYIALALAAVCIVLDKFMGFSSSWMRYMTTAVKLQKALADFQTDWILIWSEVKDNIPTVEQNRQLLQRIKDFRLKMLAEIEQETQMWTHEFQSNLAQLERVTQTQPESLRPGILDLTVIHGLMAEQGLTVMINGLTVAHTRGERVQIGHILPGQHDVKVHGMVDGKEILAAGVVNMIAGTTVELKLSLPINIQS